MFHYVFFSFFAVSGEGPSETPAEGTEATSDAGEGQGTTSKDTEEEEETQEDQTDQGRGEREHQKNDYLIP